MDAMLEKKLREMLDRDEIWRVLQRFARGVDRMDRELLRSCYFDDAIEDHSMFVGKAEDFLTWVDQVTLSYEWTQHGLQTHNCELEGDDAYCETYFQFTGRATKPPHLLAKGRYIDHLQRRNGEWRIANRVTLVEGNFALFDSEVPLNPPCAYSNDPPRPATHDRNDTSYQRPLSPRKPHKV
jgi:ketosteroid isomerase-like protein